MTTDYHQATAQWLQESARASFERTQTGVRSFAQKMLLPQPEPAEITGSDLQNAKLFANRNDMVRALLPDGCDIVAEIGVALGEFSEFMIKKLNVKEFRAFDLFDMHNYPTHWGRSSEEIFGGKTHQEYFEAKFPDNQIKIIKGDSGETLARQPSNYFDMIYVDGRHDFTGVSSDAKEASRMIKPGGLLIFNDYTLVDPLLVAPYGVVQAVNNLVREQGFKIVGFALQRLMFADIAVRAPH